MPAVTNSKKSPTVRDTSDPFQREVKLMLRQLRSDVDAIITVLKAHGWM